MRVHWPEVKYVSDFIMLPLIVIPKVDGLAVKCTVAHVHLLHENLIILVVRIVSNSADIAEGRRNEIVELCKQLCFTVMIYKDLPVIERQQNVVPGIVLVVRIREFRSSALPLFLITIIIILLQIHSHCLLVDPHG